MKKQSFIIVVIVIALVALYVLWSSGKLPGQVMGPEPLPTITKTDATNDIEQDLNNVTITEEDEGFTEINTDLKSL